MHPCHHGFRSGHSTATGLFIFEMFDSWVEGIENGSQPTACFLDLSGTFEIVDHSVLLEKLGLYGFLDCAW